MLQGILNYAHHLLKESISPGDLVVDATCGNGNDTLFLAKLVGEKGKVLAFDIQEQAIKATESMLEEHHLHHVTLIQDSHAFIAHYLKAEENIAGAIFNLGYLPKSDKTIITKSSSTLQALEQLLEKLKKKGLIVFVVYHGHEGGKEEKDSLIEFVSQLEQKKYHVLQYQFINQKNNPPFILAIKKR